MRLGSIISALALAAMLVLTFVIKLPSVAQGAPNLEATYHVLLTEKALLESPVTEHRLLPTVTLGGQYDRFVPWASAVALASGHYVYTSFPITSFLAPLAYFELTEQLPNRSGLFQFATLLQLAVVLALMALLTRWLQAMGRPRHAIAGAALAGVVVQMLSSEALLAYGAVYWAQQLYQLVFILSLICLLGFLQAEPGQGRRWLAGLCALCFAGVWIEWTGVVFSAGVFLIFYWRSREVATFRPAAIGVAIAAAGALLTMMAHYILFIGWYELLNAYVYRGGPRSALNGSPFALLAGHVRSFGLFIAVAAVAGWIAWRERRAFPDGHRGAGALLLLAAAFPMLENIVLIEHATEFSFDRLKLAVPLALLIALGVAMIHSASARLLAWAALVLCVAQNVWTFQATLAPYRNWAGIERANEVLVREIAPLVELSCAVLASDHRVRAYDNLLFHRAIYQDVKPAAFRERIGSEQARRCGAVYLQGEIVHTDLTRYTGAIVWKDGRVTRLSPPAP